MSTVVIRIFILLLNKTIHTHSLFFIASLNLVTYLYMSVTEIEKDMVFVYPDMKTVLVGKFENGVMLEGRPSKIYAERCNDGIKEIKVATPLPDSPVFKFERSTRISVGDKPTKMDMYEKKNVYIKKTKWGDEGLFAKRNIKKHELVAYYNGIFQNSSEFELFPGNLTGLAM